MSVRRLLLDPILAEAAAAAGAEVWMGAKVTALVRDRGRVTGVRFAHNGSEQSLGARLVVGADGRNSTVARLAGSRKYNLTPNERFFYWSFFADADPGAEPTVIFHRWSGTFVVATPTDSGLYQVLAMPELGELPRFRQNLEESYLEYVRRCGPVAQAYRGHGGSASSSGCSAGRGSSARRRAGVGTGRRRWPFQGPGPRPGHSRRVPAGRVPVAGDPRRHRQVAVRAGRGARGLGALARRGRGRALLARHRPRQGGLGACGATGDRTAFVERGKLDSFTDLFNHRSVPSKVLTPPRLLAATARLLARGGCDRRALLGEVGGLIAQDARRKRLARHPHYVSLEASVNAGRTEVEDDDAVGLR